MEVLLTNNWKMPQSQAWAAPWGLLTGGMTQSDARAADTAG